MNGYKWGIRVFALGLIGTLCGSLNGVPVAAQERGVIDLADLPNYADQAVPNYISRDNTPINNAITDAGATLGRVLFYDKRLSIDDSVSCASCHQQEFAFGDPEVASVGVNGLTGRHSMRLINTRFSEENNAFWDERVLSIEEQATQPIHDAVEMGFSGANGQPTFDDLIAKLEGVEYYPPLFREVFGDDSITEERMQLAIAQFVRSIQSFDSRYDEGRSQVRNNNRDFPNFTDDENAGKNLFMQRPDFNDAGQRIGGGVNCNVCHRAPEFDIDPDSLSNGVIRAIDGTIDTTNTKSPTLRDLVNADGVPHGGFMHDGGLTAMTLEEVVAHYNAIPDINDERQYRNGLDRRLRPGGNLQQLNLTSVEQAQLVAFLKTLTGSTVYTDVKWSDPFDVNNQVTVLEADTSVGSWFMY